MNRMVFSPRLKILHILSQRPDATGSGFFLQNMLRQSAARGHNNYLVCGVPAGDIPVLNCIDEDRCSFVLFDSPDLHFPIPGMSDVMPYRSSIFSKLTEKELQAYDLGGGFFYSDGSLSQCPQGVTSVAMKMTGRFPE